MKPSFRRVLAACLALGCAASAAALLPVNAEGETGKVIYATDFEDGDVSCFSNRGGDDTTEISASTDAAVSGSTALLASGRSQDWNGPAFRLDTVCEPNTEYYVSLKVKGRYYTQATLSFQFDSAGQTNYSNLVQNINGSDWYSIENVKVSFTDDMENVFVYVEGGQDDIFIDDFSITEVPVKPIEEDIPSLRAVFADDFIVGTALTPSDLSSKSFMALCDKHFSGSVTVGNELKPDSVLNREACLAYVEETGDDTNPQVSFAKAAPVLNYCKRNNIPVRVHTLVWHSQTPDWFFKENYDPEGDFVSSEKMLQRMENYIKNYFETLTELYPDVNFYACDVVNEAWTDGGTPREPGVQGQGGSEQSAWVQVFGDNSFIEPAFTYARKYAPKGCKLYYNDYNEYMDGKMNAIVEMATNLKEKGLIDGIGMQSHLDARQSLDASFPSVNMYNRALDTYAALGLDIQITELDATIPEQDPENYYDVQADYYKGIIDAIVAHKDSVSALIFWGITDDISWRAKNHPLVFDKDYKAKPAYYAIIEGRDVPDQPPTNPPVVTEPPVTETDKPPVSGELTLGDVNEDGDIDLVDVVLLNKHLMIGTEVSAQGLDNADVDRNGEADEIDSLNILKYIIQIVTFDSL